MAIVDSWDAGRCGRVIPALFREPVLAGRTRRVRVVQREVRLASHDSRTSIYPFPLRRAGMVWRCLLLSPRSGQTTQSRPPVDDCWCGGLAAVADFGEGDGLVACTARAKGSRGGQAS